MMTDPHTSDNSSKVIPCVTGTHICDINVNKKHLLLPLNSSFTHGVKRTNEKDVYTFWLEGVLIKKKKQGGCQLSQTSLLSV